MMSQPEIEMFIMALTEKIRTSGRTIFERKTPEQVVKFQEDIGEAVVRFCEDEQGNTDRTAVTAIAVTALSFVAVRMMSGVRLVKPAGMPPELDCRHSAILSFLGNILADAPSDHKADIETPPADQAVKH